MAVFSKHMYDNGFGVLFQSRHKHTIVSFIVYIHKKNLFDEMKQNT